LPSCLSWSSFSSCNSLWSLSFDSGSKLSRREAKALFRCSSLKSVCVPASVESVGEGCFDSCRSLSSLTCEPD
jgi:hypothetical protein